MTTWTITEDRNSSGELIAHFRHRRHGGWDVTQRRLIGGRWAPFSWFAIARWWTP